MYCRILLLSCALFLTVVPISLMAQAENPEQSLPAGSPPQAPVLTPVPLPSPAAGTGQESAASAVAEPAKAAVDEPPKKSRSTVVSAGLGYRTTNWSHFESPSNTNVTYQVKTATNTIVEGDLAVPKTGLRLGFSATTDGGISDASRYLGYLGFEGLSLRSETGSFSGSAHLSGLIATGQSRDVNFQQVYHYTELDYTFHLSEGVPWFVGLRYTKWNLPAEIALLSANQTSGPTTLDSGFQSSFYSLLSGFDLFKDPILIGDEKPSSGFGVMGSFVVGIGLGNASVSDATAQNVQAIYSKTLSSQSLDVFTVHLTGQLGPKYTFISNGFSGSVGIGYDINLLDLIASQTGDGSTTPSNQLDPVAYPNFIYQGWIFRLTGTF